MSMRTPSSRHSERNQKRKLWSLLQALRRNPNKESAEGTRQTTIITGPIHTHGSFHMKESCENCRYWNKREGWEYGQCRKNPPTVFIVPSDYVPTKTQWPLTNDTDWCGEWKPAATT